MKEMRVALVAVAVIFLGTPFAHAAEPQCLKPGQSVTVSSRDALKGEAKRLVGCFSDQCSDEEVTLTQNTIAGFTTSATVELRTKRECKTEADKKKYGCAKGQIQPTATIVLNQGGRLNVLTVSKCKPAQLLNALKTTIDTGDASSLAELVESSSPSRDSVDAIKIPADITTDAGKRQLAEELHNVGVPNAEEVARRNPSRALDMLRAIVDGDKEKAQNIAGELGLNDDVVSNVGRISDEVKEYRARLSSELSERQVEVTQEKTGFEQKQNIPNVAQTAAEMCHRLGGCGQACLYLTNSLTCSTNNPGAVVDSAIARRFGCVGCGRTNNTACCPTMEQGVALQTSLLMTSGRYFGNGNMSILGAICNGYAESNCGAYAYFVARHAGVSPHQTIDPKNSELMARIVTAMSRWENGRGVIFTPDQLQRGMEMAYGTRELPSGTPGFATQYATPPSTGYQFSSPFNVAGPASPSQYSPSAATQSAPSGGVPQPSYSPQQAQVAPSGSTPGVGTFVQIPPVVQPGVAQPSSGTTVGETTSLLPLEFKPVLAVTTQSKNVKKGNTFLVSWSSVGTAFKNVACETIHKHPDGSTSHIAQNREGSKVIQTGDLAIGEHTFVFECGIEGGGSHKKETSILLK